MRKSLAIQGSQCGDLATRNGIRVLGTMLAQRDANAARLKTRNEGEMRWRQLSDSFPKQAKRALRLCLASHTIEATLSCDGAHRQFAGCRGKWDSPLAAPSGRVSPT